MKKILSIFMVVLIVGLQGCTSNNSKIILNTIELDGTKCDIEKEVDTHGGFLGDGDYFAQIKCYDLKPEDLSSNWKKLPLSDELKEIMGMKQCDDNGCKDVYEKYSIPQIENGYYYFIDRHSEAKDRYDSTDLNNRSSWNFTLAMLDMDSSIIYYYKLDT